MNITKKTIAFSLVLALFWSSAEGMASQAGQKSPATEQLAESKSSKLNFGNYDTLAWFFGDYLIQLGSIYSIDSTSSNAVNGLAKARAVLNVLSLLKSCSELLARGYRTLEASPDVLIHLISGYFRGKNIGVDSNIWNNSNSIASTNMSRKSDKNLDNKKNWQYGWLTLNKVLPRIMHELLGRNSFANYKLLTEISELYRQRLMYAMIANK